MLETEIRNLIDYGTERAYWDYNVVKQNVQRKYSSIAFSREHQLRYSRRNKI